MLSKNSVFFIAFYLLRKHNELVLNTFRKKKNLILTYVHKYDKQSIRILWQFFILYHSLTFM